MTEQEKFIISLIACDEETGKHLMRTLKEWGALHINIDDYILLKDELELAIQNFKWTSDDESSYREKELLVHYKSAQDYDFDEIVCKMFKEGLT